MKLDMLKRILETESTIGAPLYFEAVDPSTGAKSWHSFTGMVVNMRGSQIDSLVLTADIQKPAKEKA